MIFFLQFPLCYFWKTDDSKEGCQISKYYIAGSYPIGGHPLKAIIFQKFQNKVRVFNSSIYVQWLADVEIFHYGSNNSLLFWLFDQNRGSNMKWFKSKLQEEQR